MEDDRIYEYKRVRNILWNQIAHMQPGKRIPSERDYAKSLGVARLTVNRAVNDLTKLGYLTKRQRSGSYVSLQHLENRKPIIGVLAFSGKISCDDGDSRMLFAAMYDEAVRYDYAIEYITVMNAKQFLGDLTALNLDALVWYGIDPEDIPVFNEYSRQHPGRTFGIYNKISGISPDPLHFDTPDVFVLDINKSVSQPFKHLIECGCKKIMHAKPPHEKEEYFRTALESAGLVYEDISVNLQSFIRQFPSIYRKQKPDGLILSNMKQLQFVRQFVKEKGIRVPEDLQFIYIGGWTDGNETQFLKPFRPMVHNIFSCLSARLEGGESELDKSLTRWELISGKTTGK